MFKSNLYNKINRWYFYKIARTKVNIKHNRLSKLNGRQKMLLHIISELMKSKETDFLMNSSISTVGEKLYIKKETSDSFCFVIIERVNGGYLISLVIHENDNKHHYDIWFDESRGSDLIKKYYKIIYNRKNSIEKKILEEDEINLTEIYNRIKGG